MVPDKFIESKSTAANIIFSSFLYVEPTPLFATFISVAFSLEQSALSNIIPVY
jgi:hypothetical protein